MKKSSDFREYNKCLISNLMPHEEPNISNIRNELKDKKLLFARWTSDFDCQQQTEWWWVINDKKYNLDNLKSKDRYEVKKGRKNFTTRIINPKEYLEEMISVYNEANKTYSKLSRNDSIKTMEIEKNKIYIGTFDLTDNSLSAYSICELITKGEKKVLNLSVEKSLPTKKNKGVNAALIDFICDYYLNKENIDYIYDGERAIRHVTNFQDYLEKYFGFRKAYCKLNIYYSKKMKFAVNMLYPVRKIIKLFSNNNRFLYDIYITLKQEEIRKTFK